MERPMVSFTVTEIQTLLDELNNLKVVENHLEYLTSIIEIIQLTCVECVGKRL